jgi:hypothetical protein
MRFAAPNIGDYKQEIHSYAVLRYVINNAFN